MTDLATAQMELRGRLLEGTDCPCCGRFAKMYRRRINSGMALTLIRMWQSAGQDWVHIPTQLVNRNHEHGKLGYWGLIEESDGLREDGGRAGWWRVTPKGRAFVGNQIRVPKYAYVFDRRVWGFDSTHQVDIRDALGSRFDYRELMS